MAAVHEKAPAKKNDSPKEMAMATEPTPAALRDRVLQGFGSFADWPRLTPLLPAQWPDSTGEAEWLAYRSTLLPTGMTAYTLEGPIAKVTLKLPEGDALQETFTAMSVKGRVNEGMPSPNLAAAEQALIGVLLGHRSPDSARSALQPYRAWVEATPLMGPDVRSRKRAFFDWLDSVANEP